MSLRVPIIWLFALFLLASCSSNEASGRITFNMGWLPQGSVGGVIVAHEKGYFREAGLDVSLARGFGGIRTVNEVDRGLFQFGYGDPVAVALNRSKGGHTQLIGAVNKQWPAGLCHVAGRRDLRRPADLEGLTIGGGTGSPIQVLLPLLLKRNGVDPAKVRILEMDPAVIDVSLVRGVIDAAECWRGSNKAVVELYARRAGATIAVMGYEQFKLDMYGSGIVASQAYLDKQPETARTFLAAVYKGYRWAAAHPGEAADMVARRYPGTDKDVVRQQIEETVALMGPDDSIGRFDPEQMRQTADFLSDAYRLDTPIAASDIYSNAYLPDVEQERE